MADKSTVTFVNTSSEVKKTMEGLSKTALRASGKVVRKYLRQNVPTRSKRFKNHIGSWVMIDRKTGRPQLQVGFYSWQKVRKNHKQPSRANPHWVEFGVRAHPINPNRAKALAYDDTFYGKKVNHPGTRATHVLRDTVYDHIGEIRSAQEEYLKELSREIDAAKSKIYTGSDKDEYD